MGVKKMTGRDKFLSVIVILFVLVASIVMTHATSNSEQSTKLAAVSNYSVDYAQISIGAGQMVSANYAAEAILSVSGTEQVAQSTTNYDVSNSIGGMGLPVPVTLSAFEID